VAEGAMSITDKS